VYDPTVGMASQLLPAARHRLPALRAAIAALALWSSGMGAVVAADPSSGTDVYDPARLLERELTDAALVDLDRAHGTLDLLTLGPSPGVPGGSRIALLRRDETWTQLDEALVVPSKPDGGDPWLVDMGTGRFALIAPLGTYERTSPQGPRSAVYQVTVDRSQGRPMLTVGPAVEISEMVTDAGLGDVDGDGAAELVLAGQSGADGECASPAIAVLSGRGSLRLDRQTNVEFEGWGECSCLTWWASGEWDGRAGADLLAHGVEDCGFFGEEAPPARGHLTAIRLRDLSTIVDVPLAELQPEDGQPVVIDVDADGRDELVLFSAEALSVVDPVDDWRPLLIAEHGITLLGAASGQPGSPGASLTWIAGTAVGASGMGIRSARLARVLGSLVMEGLAEQPFTDHTLAEVERLVWAQQEPAFGNPQPNVMAIDVDLDNCPDLVAPLLFAGCGGTGRPQVGPPYVASRPLLEIGSGDESRLLVAQSLMWDPHLNRPPWEASRTPGFMPGLMDAPAPALANPPGSWRQPARAPFLLAEVPTVLALPGSGAAVAAPVIETAVASDGSITVHGAGGSRILLRVQELCSCHVNDPVDLTGSWETFLSTEAQGFEFDAVARIRTPPGGTPAETGEAVQVPLAPDWALIEPESGGPWLATAVALDALGRPTAPVSVIAAFDRTPPLIALDVPLLNPPWPFDASIGGTSEPGASVRLADARPVTVDEDGRFSLPTQLAPWPQTIVVTAVDPSGNTSTATISVMGGLDISQVTGPAVLAVGVFVGGVLSMIRGGGRPPKAMDVKPSDPRRANPSATDDGPVIEELWERDLRRDS
jgi:hypothetical protein